MQTYKQNIRKFSNYVVLIECFICIINKNKKNYGK